MEISQTSTIKHFNEKLCTFTYIYLYFIYILISIMYIDYLEADTRRISLKKMPTTAFCHFTFTFSRNLDIITF